MRILNMGSLNNDYVYTVDHMVREGETIAASALEDFCGGKGLNQSIALANAGIEVYHAGLIGEDGDLLLETCKKYKVDTTFVKKIEGKCGHAIIQVDKNAKNSILLYGGSNRKISKTFVDEVLQHFESGDVLLLQNEISLMDYIVESAYEKGMTIVLNPSPFDEHLEMVDMSKISIFLMNEIEGAQIAGTDQVEDVLDLMKAKYPKAKVVLTLGGEGAIYQDSERMYHQKAYNVKTVDTTAAGDTFTGYFIAGWIEGMPIEEIMEKSAKAAAIAVSRKGASDSIPLKSELNIWGNQGS